jgi:hypothetical protein
VDHDSPLAPADLNGVAQLASWSRELAANDPQSNLEARLGPVDARNVEMGRRSPVWMRSLAPAAPTMKVPSYTG